MLINTQIEYEFKMARSIQRLNIVIVQLFSQNLVLSRHSQFWSKIICFTLLRPNMNDIFISYFIEVIIAQKIF